MSRKDISVSEMMKMQYELWEKHKDTWSPMEPEHGRNFILYMIEEIGEVIAIIKKKGEDQIVSDTEVRTRFIEEMGDVMMYYMDVLNRFGVTAEEFSEIYFKKAGSNLERDFAGDHESA